MNQENYRDLCSEQDLRIESVCALAREDVPGETRPLVAPIYQSAVWALDSAETCDALYDGDAAGYIYTRDANPNHSALERVIARLEQAEAGVVFGSGMAAIAAVLTAFCHQRKRVVAARQLYGATARLLEREMARFGVAVEWVDAVDVEAVRQALEQPADILLVETLSNPLLELADLPALADVARHAGALLAVDSTFTSPYCCRPLEQGADLSVHSVTKFLAGHSDVTLGAVAGRKDLIDGVRRQARLFGGTANPFEAWLALRGIATFALRMERACANAAELAQRLEAHDAVARVYYPGLPSHPQHARAMELLDHPGAMLTFDVADEAVARSVLRTLVRVRFAPSLGDVATTISYPVATSHRGLGAEAWGEMGIGAGTLRLSVGIDHVDDVWADLSAALADPVRGRA